MQQGITLEAVADLDNLHRSAKLAKRGVGWKASVQRYMKNELRNIVRAKHQLLNGEDIHRGFHEFDLYERGKHRHISSVHFSERVIHKSLSKTALVPAMSRSFIRNNTANLKGRGTDDALKRLKADLARHYRLHGAEGYILLVDFEGYFASIPHDETKRQSASAIDDRRVVALDHILIDANGEVGLGLGGEPYQIHAVAFPNRIDHFITECCRPEGYGRYMDDIYAIHTDKLALQLILAMIRDMCARMGIKVNDKKTHIIKLTKGFTWLKKRISYGENGRVNMLPCRDSITRERRKLKKQAELVRRGEMTIEQVQQSYQSWRGGMKRLDAHQTVLSMDALYHDLFKDLAGGGRSEKGP